MSKQSFFKSLKFFSYTVLLMFAAPVVIYEAFKNQQHPLYWPVLVIGILLALAAISMGFYSVKLLMDAIFDKTKDKKREDKGQKIKGERQRVKGER